MPFGYDPIAFAPAASHRQIPAGYDVADRLLDHLAGQVRGVHVPHRPLQLAGYVTKPAGAHLPQIDRGHERAHLDSRSASRLDAAVHFAAGDHQVERVNLKTTASKDC